MFDIRHHPCHTDTFSCASRYVRLRPQPSKSRLRASDRARPAGMIDAIDTLSPVVPFSYLVSRSEFFSLVDSPSRTFAFIAGGNSIHLRDTTEA